VHFQSPPFDLRAKRRRAARAFFARALFTPKKVCKLWPVAKSPQGLRGVAVGTLRSNYGAERQNKASATGAARQIINSRGACIDF